MSAARFLPFHSPALPGLPSHSRRCRAPTLSPRVGLLFHASRRPEGLRLPGGVAGYFFTPGVAGYFFRPGVAGYFFRPGVAGRSDVATSGSSSEQAVGNVAMMFSAVARIRFTFERSAPTIAASRSTAASRESLTTTY